MSLFHPGRSRLVTVWWWGGVSPAERRKPPVDEAITTSLHRTPGASRAFLPCRAAVVAPDPHLHRRADPPAPGGNRVAVAEAEPGTAGFAGPGPPAPGRAVRSGRGRVRGGDGDRVAVRDRDRGAAGGPGPEAAEGGAGREEGRVPVRGPGRHPGPDRPGGRGPAVPLRQAPLPRDEPAGPRRSRRAAPVGVRGAARLGPRHEGRLDLGHRARAGRRRAARPCR